MSTFKKPDLIEWQPGKIDGFYGKELLEEKNGGLKLVKVEALSSYPTHLHPDKTEFIYVLEGKPTISIGDESKVGERGDFFILPNSIKHSIDNQTTSKCILLVGSIKK